MTTEAERVMGVNSPKVASPLGAFLAPGAGPCPQSCSSWPVPSWTETAVSDYRAGFRTKEAGRVGVKQLGACWPQGQGATGRQEGSSTRPPAIRRKP